LVIAFLAGVLIYQQLFMLRMKFDFVFVTFSGTFFIGSLAETARVPLIYQKLNRN